MQRKLSWEILLQELQHIYLPIVSQERLLVCHLSWVCEEGKEEVQRNSSETFFPLSNTSQTYNGLSSDNIVRSFEQSDAMDISPEAFMNCLRILWMVIIVMLGNNHLEMTTFGISLMVKSEGDDYMVDDGGPEIEWKWIPWRMIGNGCLNLKNSIKETTMVLNHWMTSTTMTMTA